MTVRQQWGIVGGVLAALAVLLGVASRTMRDELHPVDVGSAAPDFHARALGSTTAKSLADYKGQVVLINVWATWCAPCRVEMPSIERLYQTFRSRGFKVIAVNVQDPASDSAVAAFARDVGISFEVLRDSTEAIKDAYRVTGFPETFVLDTAGVIRRKFIGPYNWDSPETHALIAQLLGIKRADAPAP